MITLYIVGSLKCFWKKKSPASKNCCLIKKTSFPKRVDEAIGENDIGTQFKDTFCNLYNSVSYNNNEMNVLINHIGKLIDNKCNCGVFCIHTLTV